MNENQNEYVDINAHDNYPDSEQKIEIPTMKVIPLKKICMTIGELPTSYLETMTYYEMLVWFIEYLKNNIIPTINNNASAVQEVQNVVMELQNYINEYKDSIDSDVEELEEYMNNYFENLDVQEEINNKLDQMLEDGVLEQIIEQFLQSTALWCFDNVADMKLAQNLVNGSKCKTLGFNAYNDGGGAFYKIRTITNDDIVDEITIISLYDNLLIAELISEQTMNTKQFNINETNTDSTDKLQKAINYCITNKCKLNILSNINISQLKSNILTINGNINIDGNNHTIYNNIIGDYHSLFLITGSVNIKNLNVTNDEDNAPTANTGIVDLYDRVDFYLRECYNSLFENITINNCIGVWQFICVRCNNTVIKNNIINYNENYDLSYDRTSMYLNGFNIQCQNNILNGKTKARTGIESHGDNILIENNEIKGYRNPIYIVNDFTSDTIHNVNILNNYSHTERGICVWLQVNNVNVDTINILNNTIITTSDWYAFYTYDVLGENFTVKNINFKNNVVKHLGTTDKEAIRISPTRIGTNKNVTIENIDISNNDIKGNGTGYTINLYNQLDGCTIKNIFMINNKFFINLNTLLHYVSTQGRINNITFNNNIVRNNGTTLASVSTGVKNGELRFIDNEIEKELEVIVGGNISYNTYIKGTYPIDLLQRDLKDYYFVNVHDLNENKIETRNGVNNYTLYNDSVLTGGRFKKGDIIWNNNPVIGTPIGWVSISNDNFRIIQNILGGV